MTAETATQPGTVYLVGAGPGDPGLLTLRAVECLRRAEVVLCDYLANRAALEHAPRAAELVLLGHHRTGRSLSPAEITARMIAEARRGRTVVRLKGGDPAVFGRTADETEALREAGIPFEIVPGITAGLAAASYCEIPVTHHEDASAAALVTARQREGKATDTLDPRALAAFPGTLVVYMGVEQAAEWCGQLIEHGKPPDTPVAIVRRCSWPGQQTFRCTLGTAGEVVSRQRIRAPALFIVGKVVDRSPAVSWFAARPLFATRVLVAGAPGGARELRDRLAALGADVVMPPVVQVTPPADWGPVDAALDRIDAYDWVVIASGDGVDFLVQRLLERGEDVRRLGGVRLAAIGAGTAEHLGRHHVQADLVPRTCEAETLARDLVATAEHRRFLLAVGTRGRPELAEALERAGGHVEQIAVYESTDVAEPDPDVAADLATGAIGWIALTSVVTAESLVRLYGDAVRKARLASISPMTSEALRALGLEPAVEASPHTTAGLVEAILRATEANA